MPDHGQGLLAATGSTAGPDGAATAFDARALHWLDRLLDAADEAAREPLWSALAAEDGALADRVHGLWHAIQAETASRLQAPGPGALSPGLDDTLQPGSRIAGYRLLRPLGRGGMATVWIAEGIEGRHGVPRRQVAIKLPLATLGQPAHVLRFERERDVLARLAHPRIANLFDAGVTPEGRPFLVLEYVQGCPVTEACERDQLDVPARLRLFLQVLEAVDHAHQHLVVHRDIKPSNVFVDGAGDVKLLDFGIAKLLDEAGVAADASALTRDAGTSFTPRYAAPEQVAQQAISTATDVYGLGVLLYELLCGAVPGAQAQGSVAAAVHAVLHETPPPPSAVAAAERRAELSADLDTIVMKALRKSPVERYATVERFADDLRRFLDDRPIAARPPTLAHRMRLLVRRHRPEAAVAAAGLVAALALAGMLWHQHVLTHDQAVRADRTRDFMLDMVEDVEPAQAQVAADVTGQQIVRKALARAHDRFEGDPLLLGEVLDELGRMAAHLDDDDTARTVVTHANELLVANAPRGYAPLDKNRVALAELMFEDGRLDAAATQAGAALADCVGADPECAKARGYAEVLLARIAANRGRLDDALVHMRASVVDIEAGFGAAHPESLIGWQHLAAMARNAGEVREAATALHHAVDLSARVVLKARDREELERLRAVLALDLGHDDEAIALLQTQLAQAASGTASQRPTLLRLLATAEMAAGRPALALARADEALGSLMPPPAPADGTPHDGAAAAASAVATSPSAAATSRPPPLDAVLARQVRARALAALDRPADARADIDQVARELAARGYVATSSERLRAARIAAALQARRGDRPGAALALEALAAGWPGNSAGNHMDIEHGQLLDLLGCVKGALGDASGAASLHRQAGALLARQLEPDHPLMRRNTLYQAGTDASACPPPP